MPVSGWPGEDSATRLREALRTGHLAGADAPIVGVGEGGAFVDRELLGSTGPPVVVDADWLRNDLLRFYLRGQQTTMLTAADRSLLCLFCRRGHEPLLAPARCAPHGVGIAGVHSRLVRRGADLGSRVYGVSSDEPDL